MTSAVREQEPVWKRVYNSIDSNKAVRQGAGLGTEVVAGLALDAKTAPLITPQALLASKGLSGLAYIGWNAFGGATANIAAQRLRGEEELDWGEVISSGLLGIIPFTSFRFGKKATRLVGRPGTFQRAATGGAGMGVADRYIQSGINEGELPSASDVAVGALTGGAFGGTFQQVGKAVVTKQLKNQIIKAQQEGRVEDLQRLIFNFRKAQNTSPELDKFNSFEDYMENRADIINQAMDSIDPQSNKIINWTTYGYKLGKEPTVVHRQTNPNKKALVEQSLANFYFRTNQFLKSKRATSLSGWGQTWQDPVTNKLYSAKLIKRGNKIERLSLINVDAQIVAARRRHIRDQTSSPIQKLNRQFTDKDKRRMNLTEKSKFNKLAKELPEKIKELNIRIRSLGATVDYTLDKDRLREVYLRELADLNEKLRLLTQGAYYGEHGYALRSKVWKKIGKQKRYGPIRFKAGDDKNYHLVFQKDINDMTFKKTKDNFESVIEGTFTTQGKDPYPDYVVNYNPNLHEGNQGIIRIERLSTVKIGNQVKNIMSGDVVAEFNFNQMEDRVYSTDEIREWLRNQGIFPVTRLDYKQPPSDFKKRKK